MARWAAKVDANQAELIAVLEKCGATVYIIKEPVDLLVGYMGVTCAVEVKNVKGKNRQTKQQIEFFKEFKGMKWIIRDVGDCLTMLADMRGRSIEMSF